MTAENMVEVSGETTEDDAGAETSAAHGHTVGKCKVSGGCLHVELRFVAETAPDTGGLGTRKCVIGTGSSSPGIVRGSFGGSGSDGPDDVAIGEGNGGEEGGSGDDGEFEAAVVEGEGHEGGGGDVGKGEAVEVVDGGGGVVGGRGGVGFVVDEGTYGVAQDEPRVRTYTGKVGVRRSASACANHFLAGGGGGGAGTGVESGRHAHVHEAEEVIRDHHVDATRGHTGRDASGCGQSGKSELITADVVVGSALHADDVGSGRVTQAVSEDYFSPSSQLYHYRSK